MRRCSITNFQQRIATIKEKLNLEKLSQEIKQIENESSAPGFWQDQQKAAEKMKELAEKQKEISQIENLENLLVEEKIPELEKKLRELEIKTFLSGQYDSLPAIFSIHAGQGGTEAMDWAEMLKRMYLRYFERKAWPCSTIDESLGEEAGIKSVILKVDAPYAYGYLRREAGTHRLVRQSPFNADHLRQTSFALVEVLPQIQESSTIQINPEDLEWQFFRSSSQGGQNVQKVSTAVRLHHKPTGIIISSQAQRYQEQNRKIALELLQAKLWGLRQTQAKLEEQKLKGGRTKAAWGTQIRSYVLHPYKMVKDLRTDYETSQAESVLDGEIDGFIEAEVRHMV